MDNTRRNIAGLCCIAFIACVIFYVLQQFTTIGYVGTAISKVIFFGGVPFVYWRWFNHPNSEKVSNFRMLLKQSKIGGILGAGVMIIILVAYFVLKQYIDLDLIADELTQNSKVNAFNFPAIALYIIIGNSFLEEYFFRGFIFLSLYNKGYTKLAYIFSSLLFAVYHVAIFKTWFNPVIIGIALLGLFAGGIIFNYIDTKINSIANSWVVHIFADLAIILIGIKMFYL
jgi:membrane protease YdiL (CAAX protease family)